MIDWAKISLKDFAGFVSEELKKRGIDAVLVGGACVTIYSDNRYQSYDLDYVTYEDVKKLKKAFKEMGFYEKNKYFHHKDCPWFVEFVTPPVAIGNESIEKFNLISTSLGNIKLLYPVDSVKDRLAAFYHWDDKQSLEQAISICLEQKIDLKEVERWSKKENHMTKFTLFKDLLEKQRKE